MNRPCPTLATFVSVPALALCLALAASGCRTDATDTTSTTGAVQKKTVVMPATDPATGQPPTAAFSLDDGQILGVLHTANQGAIAQAHLATERATDARVKRLAAMLLADHTDMDERSSDLAAKAGLPTTDSPTSLSVQMNGDHATSELKTKTGEDFDKDYVAAQITEHQAVLDTIDQRLLPSANNDDLKSLLRAARPKIAEHLEHAKRVQAQLGAP